VSEHNLGNLKRHILPLSFATDWEIARKEWHMITSYRVREPETCPCSHYPIYEKCEIRNRITRQLTEVGNVCIHRFLGISSGLVCRPVWPPG
jgi:hypothetical protein